MATSYLQCVCGNAERKPWATVNGIDIVECSACGIRRVDRLDKDAYTALYSNGDYHANGSPDLPHESAGREPHKTRFDIDFAVGQKRIAKLVRYKDSDKACLVLDVGCANGAFMAAALDAGFRVAGVDLSKDALHSDLLAQYVRCGDLRSVGFQRRTADVITFNDSFEHFIDPISALLAAKGILKRDGILVIEIPDMGCPEAKSQGPAFKHVKPHEHLWYFTADQLRAVVEKHGFHVVGMDIPITGKVTIYASPAITVEEIEVHGPPGVGDTLWTLQKLRDIYEKESPCTLKYVVCCDGDHKVVSRANDFLLLSPYIDSTEFRPVPLPRDVGCEDPTYPMYELFPNNYFEPIVPNSEGKFVGGLIENWRPELPDDWSLPFDIPNAALCQARLRLLGVKDHVAVYMSSRVWNWTVAEPVWTAKHWAELLIALSESGLKPVILGAGSDTDYAKDVAEEIVKLDRNPAKIWINTIGRTALPLAMAYMHTAKVTVGIANGLPMLPLYTGGRAVIFWPVRGLSKAVKTQWTPEFCYGWLPKHIRESGRYKYLVVGCFAVNDAYCEIKKLAENPAVENAVENYVLQITNVRGNGD